MHAASGVRPRVRSRASNTSSIGQRLDLASQLGRSEQHGGSPSLREISAGQPPITRATFSHCCAQAYGRLAAVEGLTLVPSTGSLDGRKAGSVSKWGFKGVSYKAKIGMFHAALGTESIGSFRSAPEAALAYARRLGPEGSAESARRALA